jgi:SAM-dependent methyltransferase
MDDFFTKSMSRRRLCAICDSSDNHILYRQSFSKLSDCISLLSGYDVVVCLKCGFCFADCIPEQSVFDAYYREMSKYEKTDRGGQDTPNEQARFQKMANLISRFLPSTTTRIFEIGCANGQLLAMLKNMGYKNVSGIDPSLVCAETARRKYGIPVTNNTISDVIIGDNEVDFLILVGVLEHVRDVRFAVQKLKKMLSMGGNIYISVPDASRYPEGKDAPFQEFSVEHINFFGPDSLLNLMRVTGFKQVSLKQDMVSSSIGTTTPVINGLFQKSNQTFETAISVDSITEEGLNLYINQSTCEDKHIQARIEVIVSIGQPIMVWGTGAHTLRLLATSKLGEAKIRAFVDSNPRYQGKQLNGVPIVAPQAIKDWSEPILISSRVYQEEIARQISDDLRLKNPIIRLYELSR